MLFYTDLVYVWLLYSFYYLCTDEADLNEYLDQLFQWKNLIDWIDSYVCFATDDDHELIS